jgi:hypothetical protein
MFAKLYNRLDAIVELLRRIVELLESVPGEPAGEPERACGHTRTEDRSCMGDLPGSRIYCLDCGARVEGREP